MKKTVSIAGAILALGVLCYVGRLWAQSPPPAKTAPAAPAAAPRTHVALINLTYVIKNYIKYTNFQEEIKGTVKPFQDKDTKLRKEAEELAKTVPPGTPPGTGKRAEVDPKLKDIQRKIEDNSTEAKVQVGKKSDEQMKILYGDVVEAAQRYATGHDFDMVLHYNDATTKEDYFGAPNIARKLQSGALMPLYAAPGMDISLEVVRLLNYNLRPATTQGPAPTTPPAGGGQR